MMYHIRVPAALALSVVSIGLAIGNVWLSIRATKPDKVAARSYTYVGSDYPEFYIPAGGDLPPVAMTMEESRHYSIEGPNALEEWASNSAVGFGYVRFGPEYRTFVIAMFHEIHCLHALRFYLTQPKNGTLSGHAQHCLNYLRQFILCSPNLTLEPPDVLTRDFETERVGATHVCRNWEVMYQETAANWHKWDPIRRNRSLPV